MPAISRIRFTNVIYENGGKRYNDETFLFDGHNTAFLLENGGGKTVFIQTALQAILPHVNMAERKIKDTLSLENAPAHVAIEWIINDKPRRYAMTAVSLYIENNALNSLKYTYDYDAEDGQGIEDVPFSIALPSGAKRPASRGEMSDYYTKMAKQSVHANVFGTHQAYGKFIENTYKIIPSEWRKVATINSGEGNVDEFFNRCKTTEQLLSNLLIPVIEEAIEGDHTSSFVDTFQRQREHFKKNRILQDKIEQSQLIKEKIDGYVSVYKKYEKERLALQALTSEAKTVAQYVRNQKVNKENELVINEEHQTILQEDRKVYDQERKSYELHILKEQVKDLEGQKHKIGSHLEKVENDLDQVAARKQNIEWSILAKEIDHEKAHIETLKDTLKAADSTFEISDLKQQLDENSSHIKGQYVYELALIEREEETLKTGGKALDDALLKIEAQHQSSLSYEKDLLGKNSQLEATIAMIEEENERLKEGIFEGDEPWTVALKKDSLLSRKVQLSKDISAYEERLQELRQYIQTKSKAREALVEHKLASAEALTRAKQQLEVIEKSMNQVSSDVEAAGYPLYLNGNLYSKEVSIIKELEEQCVYADKQKELAIEQERFLMRYVEGYEKLTSFMAEPRLEALVKTLKESLSFVELGSVYTEDLKRTYGLTGEQVYNRYPFWAITVVTSVKEVEKVKAAIKAQEDHLSQMLIVLSREEATQLGRSGESMFSVLHEKAVNPKRWTMSTEQDHYNTWQQNLCDEAQKGLAFRKEKEQQLVRCNKWLQNTRAFFSEFPYALFEGLKGEIAGHEQNLKQVSGDLTALELAIAEDQDSLVKVTERLGKITIEKQNLEGDLDLVSRLDKGEQRLRQLEADRAEAMAALSLLGNQLEAQLNDIKALETDSKSLLSQSYRYASERDKIIGQDLYQEVKDFEPYGTNASVEGLKEQRKRLKAQLAGVDHNRSEVEARLKDHEQMLLRFTQEQEGKRREAKYELALIDAYYEKETEELFDKIMSLRKKVGQLKTQWTQEDRDLTQIKTRSQILEETLEEAYGGAIVFDIDQVQIEQRLDIKKATLMDRQRKLVAEKHHIEKAIRQLDHGYRELEIKDGMFNYLAIDVVPAKLKVDYFEGFDEAIEDRVHELLQSLEGQYNKNKKELKVLQAKEEEVLSECRQRITDRRLLETLASGLGAKKSYEDLLVYQEKMTEIIMKIIKVAEDDKRESDIELQAFLSHLLAYVKNVSKELDVIQSKTRINVDDEVKQIFVFDIPDWDEAEAKLRLRNYIDATILFYEKESLHEDISVDALRKSLVERLSVMSLLEVVMEERSIKIKCRKVSNDMKINKAPMAWESSNKWSGGEKWSKNMTLFLSILNYLAEKKQHLSPNQKRQRSVILDNPFGKASSDHVLKPVFMIADKLGFQIIALTAHAEGKFISEYFPVVYSCRLRKTKDPSKQVMTNEKVLNYSYLREHSPMTIMRMQEVEQMTLF